MKIVGLCIGIAIALGLWIVIIAVLGSLVDTFTRLTS